MINEITQDISPITALPDLLSENRPAAVNLLVEVELPRNSIEMKNLVEQLNTFKTEVNATAEEIEIVKDEAEEARDITVAAKNEALTAVATLQEGAIDDTIIAPNKAFSNQYIENNYYDKDEVDTAINNSSQINILPHKPTPDDTDNLALQEVGGDLKKVSFQNLTKLSPNDSRVKTALNASGDAPIYACRAWVNFNGTGTVAIRASGNVSSVTDNGVGDYTISPITGYIDSSFSGVVTGGNGGGANADVAWATFKRMPISASSFTFQLISMGGGGATYSNIDCAYVCAAIFR